MEKYIVKNATKNKPNDSILNYLKQENLSLGPEIESFVHKDWNSKEKIKSFSISQVAANDTSKLTSSASLKGWKKKDGKKVYTTFRNGKLVTGVGKDAFKLSLGDKTKTKSNKVKIQK